MSQDTPPIHLLPPEGTEERDLPVPVAPAIQAGETQFRTPTYRVILAVTGSIAAFRAADIASQLTKLGLEVDVVLTAAALKFITPLTFQALTRRDVYTDESPDMRNGQPLHIALADNASLVLIAPATAHVLAQYALGLAPDLLTSTLLALPPDIPVLAAPAMNGKMWLHPAVQQNTETLRKRGVDFIGPDEGLLACGYEGVGRMDPVERITAVVTARLEALPECG